LTETNMLDRHSQSEFLCY